MSYEKITTVEAAFEAEGLSPNNLPDVSMLLVEDGKHIQEHYKRVVVTRAINGGVKPDYTDGTWKYELVIGIKRDGDRPSGFGVSVTYSVNGRACTGCGSRLQFLDQDRLNHFIKHFPQLIEDTMLN